MKTKPALSALAHEIARTSLSFAILDRQEVFNFADGLYQAFFPQMRCQASFSEVEILAQFERIKTNLTVMLSCLARDESFSPNLVCDHFFEELPEMYQLVLDDAEAHLRKDPAAKSLDEVIRAYPGFLAITYYRFAHRLLELEVPLLPRLISRYAHQLTGVEIHPGATIGKRFAIDHGTGVVIGETAHIGDDVMIYQGVTLGALHVKKELENIKRHPTVEENVVIYANATILGGKTVIGRDSIIGGNSWITESITPGSRIYRKSE
jgi:serine O-acetyltransferase